MDLPLPFEMRMDLWCENIICNFGVLCDWFDKQRWDVHVVVIGFAEVLLCSFKKPIKLFSDGEIRLEMCFLCFYWIWPNYKHNYAPSKRKLPNYRFVCKRQILDDVSKSNQTVILGPNVSIGELRSFFCYCYRFSVKHSVPTRIRMW